MKTTSILPVFILLINALFMHAQDRTTVTANTDEISDNLDLRAIASIFGDAKDLADFERQLNDPDNRISNLDLNNDNRVDYLRVIESAEGNAHLVIIQAVIGPDLYQDVATIEVERDNRNNTRVLVVGDVYMYGDNYIYEPVYYQSPLIFNYLWTVGYRPYCSSWYWGYYPYYFRPWAPVPIYTYTNYIAVHINQLHQYNYVNVRPINHRAYLITRPARGNAFELRHPTRSFSTRNEGIRNRQELENVRRGTPQRAAPNENRQRDQRRNREEKTNLNTRRNSAFYHSSTRQNSEDLSSQNQMNQTTRSSLNNRGDQTTRFKNELQPNQSTRQYVYTGTTPRNNSVTFPSSHVKSSPRQVDAPNTPKKSDFAVRVNASNHAVRETGLQTNRSTTSRESGTVNMRQAASTHVNQRGDSKLRIR